MALILSSVDEKIENTDKLIEKTKEFKKGLMQRLLTKGIGHDRFKDTEIGRIPEEWKVSRLGEITEFSQGVQIALEEQNLEVKENLIRFLRIIDYTQNTKDYRYIANPGKRYIVDYDDIVMVRYGATAGFVGKGHKGAIANNMFKIIPDEKELNKKFLYLFLKQEKIYKSLNSATGASAMPAINFGLVSKVKIVIPSLVEQKQIASILSCVDEKIEQFEYKKEKLQELKNGLMQKLLTGKIRVEV
jgi:type I restriction enzyme S subunit